MKSNDFIKHRRQKFLTKDYYDLNRKDLISSNDNFRKGRKNLLADGDLSPAPFLGIFNNSLDALKLQYTAGIEIESLQPYYADVVSAADEWSKATHDYFRKLEEISGEKLTDNPSIFSFDDLLSFQTAIDVVSIGILLGDGVNLRRFLSLLENNRCSDLLFESIVEPAVSYSCDNNDFFHVIPYDPLLDSFCTAENQEDASGKILEYLDGWYKNFEQAPWHNGHLRGIKGDYMPYYGYWAFEAAAVSVIYGIDDTVFRDHLIYPKDLADWARANHSLDRVAPGAQSSATGYRCEAGQPCPRSGYWSTPAQSGSRQYFKQGTVMPTISSDYGVAIWQWDRDQSDPSL